ncbi:MAG: hypothetical protein KAJ01_02325, partial [Candidatus Hydrogenedentes bacterium]|nr:hypothetical protein [Candidatus Hydrogenedentota bacterium]
ISQHSINKRFTLIHNRFIFEHKGTISSDCFRSRHTPVSRLSRCVPLVPTRDSGLFPAARRISSPLASVPQECLLNHI